MAVIPGTFPEAPLACLECGMPDPPPEPTCGSGRDHYVGRRRGCPHCGRLKAACARLPCTPMRADPGG